MQTSSPSEAPLDWRRCCPDCARGRLLLHQGGRGPLRPLLGPAGDKVRGRGKDVEEVVHEVRQRIKKDI